MFRLFKQITYLILGSILIVLTLTLVFFMLSDEAYDSLMKFSTNANQVVEDVIMNPLDEMLSTNTNKVIEDVIHLEKIHTIEYRLTYPETVSITYQTSNGDVLQYAGSYKTSIPVEANPGDFYYMAIQNDADYGEVSIDMYVDNELYESDYSSGASAIANVAGVLYELSALIIDL